MSSGKSMISSVHRVSLPTDVPLEEQPWPNTPVSLHTINLRMNIMNQDPKDLHTARLIIEELRVKVRFQTDHIMRWKKAYAIQVGINEIYKEEIAE